MAVKRRKRPAARGVVEPAVLSLAEFERRFPLVANPFEDAEPAWQNDDDEGCLFETFGEQLDFVQGRDELFVWTVMDDDTVQSGYHVANRSGYLVSSVRRQRGEHFVVRLDD
ncbi:MAG: hypothetical protein JNJ54_14650 [Myxococcaceae bacterium]|nr:hypothetical protein [Myxococcaceae bacterium]